MTTFEFAIKINDGEAIALKASLELMIKHCQQKLDEGAGSPYWAHRESSKSILDKLEEETKKISWKNKNKLI